MKKTLGCLRKADEDFGLIGDGDAIAVGVSGGKDSMLLLKALSLYRLFSKKDYSITAITIGPGMGFDPAPIEGYCKEEGIPFVFEDAGILEEAQRRNPDPTKPPCPLCAVLRRGALNNAAKQAGCNKVALGHHRDDALETFLMSMFYEGRLYTLEPKTYLSRTDITVIRPFLYLNEKHIIGAGRAEGLPIQPSVCPFDGHTTRQHMKELLKELRNWVPRADEMMFRALRNTKSYHLWDRSQAPPATEGAQADAGEKEERHERQ
ncbi:tRNA 2-thiocytidine(32) synthetase TtcA [Eubacteriales bacterium OttesenSCG-928-M02]|nr:tRNA 2-thiocytidine(32) synthetase TtcA [Eubacteriales bacterium OttesenSCG-928-M02]